MPYKNKKLSTYEGQEHLPNLEKTDWSKIPETILPQTKKKSGNKTAAYDKWKKGKYANGYVPENVKIEAVALYAALGNNREVARLIGVSHTAIQKWKMTQWWNEIMTRVQAEKDDELDAKLTKGIDKAITEINDRLENGDYIYDIKRGEVVRVKPKMKDVASVVALSVDKRALLRGKPTSISAKVSTAETLDKLAKEFAKFAAAKEIPGEVVA